jgi:hypothetical protein
MDTKKLRKSRIEFFSENKKVSKEFFKEKLEKKELSSDEKWFLRGCLHTTERHYTEAIKRFQLSNSDDARLLLLACCLKVADRFLFDEFYKEPLKDFKYFQKYQILPYWITEEREKFLIDLEFIKHMKNSI